MPGKRQILDGAEELGPKNGCRFGMRFTLPSLLPSPVAVFPPCMYLKNWHTPKLDVAAISPPLIYLGELQNPYHRVYLPVLRTHVYFMSIST